MKKSLDFGKYTRSAEVLRTRPIEALISTFEGVLTTMAKDMWLEMPEELKGDEAKEDHWIDSHYADLVAVRGMYLELFKERDAFNFNRYMWGHLVDDSPLLADYIK